MAKLAPEFLMAFSTAVVLLFWPKSPVTPKEKVPGTGVGPGVGVIVGVEVAPPPSAQLTRSSTRLDGASFELKVYPSMPLAASSAMDMFEPTAAVTAGVTSTSFQTSRTLGTNVVMTPPLDGRFEYVRLFSVHVLSATFLMLRVSTDSLTTHIRRVACVMGRPPRAVRSNFK